MISEFSQMDESDITRLLNPDNIRKFRGLKPSHDSGVDVCPPCAQSASGKTA